MYHIAVVQRVCSTIFFISDFLATVWPLIEILLFLILLNSGK